MNLFLEIFVLRNQMRAQATNSFKTKQTRHPRYVKKYARAGKGDPEMLIMTFGVSQGSTLGSFQH
jgi:hypothetical protein